MGGFSLARALAQTDAALLPLANARLASLGAILFAHGFEVRDDSRLAYEHAVGRMPHCSEWDVAHEMMCVQWMCRTAAYPAVQEEFLRTLATEMRKKYKLRSWNTAWKITRDMGPDLLKYVCIAQAGGIPNFVPRLQPVPEAPAEEPASEADAAR